MKWKTWPRSVEGLVQSELVLVPKAQWNATLSGRLTRLLFSRRDCLHGVVVCWEEDIARRRNYCVRKLFQKNKRGVEEGVV